MKKKIASIEPPKFDRHGIQTNIKDLNGEPLPDLRKLDFQPFKHGGARAGSGRKPSGRKAILVRLSPKLIAALRKEAKRKHTTLSEVTERRLQRVSSA